MHRSYAYPPTSRDLLLSAEEALPNPIGRAPQTSGYLLGIDPGYSLARGTRLGNRDPTAPHSPRSPLSPLPDLKVKDLPSLPERIRKSPQREVVRLEASRPPPDSTAISEVPLHDDRFGSFSSDDTDNTLMDGGTGVAQHPIPVASPPEDHTFDPWVPIPLRVWFWVPLVIIMGLGAVGFEVALYYSGRNTGWPTSGNFRTQQGFIHYVYTFPPVAISMFFGALWAWTDVEIRKLQPYVDLSHGNSPSKKSVLLDYTRDHTLWVWTIAFRNRHWAVTIGSLLVILTFCFQPLSAALFTVQDVFWTASVAAVPAHAVLGLNQNANFQDLTSFLTAAGYASADALFDVGDPMFVRGGYTIGGFDIPSALNGTLFANTTAAYNQPNCREPDPGSYSTTTGEGADSTTLVAFDGCIFSLVRNKTSDNMFGVMTIPDVPGFTQASPCYKFTSVEDPYRSAVFWFISFEQSPPTSSIVMCTPELSLWDVAVSIDTMSGKLTDVRPISFLREDPSSPLKQDYQNITGAPLYGRAYNGLFFQLNNPDPVVVSRMQAIQVALPAAVFQLASRSQGGLAGAFDQAIWAALSSRVYGLYLSLVAKTVYFLEDEVSLSTEVKTMQKRLVLSPLATHLLSAAMLVLSVVGTLMQLWHRHERKLLRLAHQPGTIASAVSIGAQSDIGNVLHAHQRTKDMRKVLGNNLFRIDKQTLKIAVEGQEGFKDVAGPVAS